MGRHLHRLRPGGAVSDAPIGDEGRRPVGDGARRARRARGRPGGGGAPPGGRPADAAGPVLRRPAAGPPEGREPPADRRLQDPRRLERDRPADRGRASPRRRHPLVRQPRPGRRPGGATRRDPCRDRHAVRRAGGEAGPGRGRRGGDRDGRPSRAAPASRWPSRLVEERGLVLVPPYDDDRIIAGQGTVGLEIAEDVPDLALVLVPIGGGGLASGVAVAVKALHPAARVVGVEPELAADAAESLREGRIVRWDGALTARTIADGTRSQAIGRRPFAHLSPPPRRDRHGRRGGDRGRRPPRRRGEPPRRRAVGRADDRRRPLPRPGARPRRSRGHGRRRRQRRERGPGALPGAARLARPRLRRILAGSPPAERRLALPDQVPLDVGPPLGGRAPRDPRTASSRPGPRGARPGR